MKGEYDLIHTHLAILFGILASHNPRRIPQIITCHGSDCALPYKRSLYAQATRHALRRADHIVTVSKYLESLVHRMGISPNKTETLYLGVDVRRFKPGKRGGPQTVGTLGRVIPEKNIEDLLWAMNLLQGKRDLRLVIEGDGPHLPHLKRLSLDLEIRDIHFHGRVYDAPGFHWLCDVFTLTSVNEGLSISLQEAMASGCVPVAAETMSRRELITEGVNGFLYKSRDAEAQATCIEAALDAPKTGA